MEKATITEVKNHLSAFLDKVKHGEPVLITDRGRPVARLETVLSDTGMSDMKGRLARLERTGLVRRARSTPSREMISGTPPPAPGQGVSLLQAVLAERKENR
ncbi:MAG: type II toxin-antitoxin system prevent-host-death family antitoxin [Mariprofundaceae bacterium]|nr:type II toxin-antitoxin system prevent-host-death family antitoxin [Mariprofundaceae bacterium]